MDKQNATEEQKLNNHYFLSDTQASHVKLGFSIPEMQDHKKTHGLKYYLLISFLRKHSDIFGQVTFRLENLIAECGYKKKTHNSTTYAIWKSLIDEWLIQTGYATSEVNILSVSPKKYFTLKLSHDPNVFFTNDNFVTFNLEEFERIASYSSGLEKAKASSMIGVYLFIKKYIPAIGDYPKLSYPSKQWIQTELGLSKSTVEVAIKCLCDTGLLFKKCDLYMKDKKSDFYIPARAIFSTDPKALDEQTCIKALEAQLNTKIYTFDEAKGNIKFL